MDIPAEIRLIEERLAAASVPLEDFLARSEIHFTTWFRWKKGDAVPRLDTWERMKAQIPAPPASETAA